MAYNRVKKEITQNKRVKGKLNKIKTRVAEVLSVKQEDVWAAGRHQETVRARSLLCYWAVRKLGVTMTSLSKLLNISVQAIGKSVIRGENLAKAKNIR